MKKKPAEIMENCPVHRALKLIGKKWALEIVMELVCGEERKLRFNELQSRLPPITPKVLSHRLTELEESGIVNREVVSGEIPKRVEYSLTKKGLGLEKVVRSLRNWGEKWAYEDYQDFCDICTDWRRKG